MDTDGAVRDSLQTEQFYYKGHTSDSRDYVDRQKLAGALVCNLSTRSAYPHVLKLIEVISDHFPRLR